MQENSEVYDTQKLKEKSKCINVILVGPPGSGKGTHSPIIFEKLGIYHLATGDMLREAVAAGTEIGKLADQIMKAGQLVPDDLVIALIKDKLLTPECA